MPLTGGVECTESFGQVRSMDSSFPLPEQVSPLGVIPSSLLGMISVRFSWSTADHPWASLSASLDLLAYWPGARSLIGSHAGRYGNLRVVDNHEVEGPRTCPGAVVHGGSWHG